MFTRAMKRSSLVAMTHTPRKSNLHALAMSLSLNCFDAFDETPGQVKAGAQCYKKHTTVKFLIASGGSSKMPTISESLQQYDEVYFSNVFTILKICGTWPVTICECERNISVLCVVEDLHQVHHVSRKDDFTGFDAGSQSD